MTVDGRGLKVTMSLVKGSAAMRSYATITVIDCEFLWIFFKFRRIHEFLQILKMLMSFKNKIRNREKLQIEITEIFDANLLIQLVTE